MKQSFHILIFFFASLSLSAQYNPLVTDTLYYEANWELCEREEASSYWVASYNRDQDIFVGPFQEYDSLGNLIAEGEYNRDGHKDGAFKRFYKNGNVRSEGEFWHDKMLGSWEYYYENGQLRERLKFQDGEYFILDYNKKNGSAGVVNGKGKWKKTFESAYGTSSFEGKVNNGLKEGKWKVRNAEGNTVMYEIYRSGAFRRGWDAHHWDYNTQSYIYLSFYPDYFDLVESSLKHIEY